MCPIYNFLSQKLKSYFFILFFCQEKMKEKDARLLEIESVGMKLQDTISKLEQDLTKSKAELHQEKKKISDTLHTEVWPRGSAIEIFLYCITFFVYICLVFT